MDAMIVRVERELTGHLCTMRVDYGKGYKIIVANFGGLIV